MRQLFIGVDKVYNYELHACLSRAKYRYAPDGRFFASLADPDDEPVAESAFHFEYDDVDLPPDVSRKLVSPVPLRALCTYVCAETLRQSMKR